MLTLGRAPGVMAPRAFCSCTSDGIHRFRRGCGVTARRVAVSSVSVGGLVAKVFHCPLRLFQNCVARSVVLSRSQLSTLPFPQLVVPSSPSDSPPSRDHLLGWAVFVSSSRVSLGSTRRSSSSLGRLTALDGRPRSLLSRIHTVAPARPPPVLLLDWIGPAF